MEEFLKARLRRVIRRHQQLGLFHKLAWCWIAGAVAGGVLLLVRVQTGWASPHTVPLLAATVVCAAIGAILLNRQKRPDYRTIAQQIEAADPELRGALLTAIQQPDEGAAANGYLRHRLLQAVVERCQQTDWRRAVPSQRLAAAHTLHFAALVCFAVVLWSAQADHPVRTENGVRVAEGISVAPGDTSIERGESLVVLARFGAKLPAGVDLIVREPAVPERKIPLVKSLADPVFGGSVAEVAKDFVYRLEYGGQRTRDFKVTVFEHPRLERSDVELTFPSYTELPPKRIEDTRRVSAVEGTKLGLALQLNKPVASATLVPRDAQRAPIPLEIAADRAVATLTNYDLQTGGTYDLRLIDADGRANKNAAPFVLDALPNRPPELRLASPRGDVRPSALEEIGFQGTVWDDFGASVYGFAYTLAGGETKFVELGRGVPGKEKRPFEHLLELEKLGVQPDQLISWYIWAEDIGPDGQPRRTSTDLFFGEVRPFDEAFRENRGMEGGEQQGESQGQGGPRQRLTELQKQIINATWKLQREPAKPNYVDDAKVLLDSQKQALEQAGGELQQTFAPRERALWTSVTNEMARAIEKLEAAAKAPGPLAQALPPEQAAYQALLRLQARDTSVSRSRSRGGQGGQQGGQRQLDQLDLADEENRYETQRQARAPQNAERREQLQVTNRLQELARRQQDLNERLKELQTALQEARTDEEREEIKRRLKRLQEEQQQMLADVDEMRQRMERPENQSRLADERRRLDETREDVQRAAEAAGEGSVAQALASGTRAQRQLQELRDDMRKDNSSQFAEELRQMRQEARDLARQQEQVGQKLDGLDEERRKSLSDTGDRKEVLEQLAQQKERVNQLVERATQISEQAESSEPLLSRQLYDTLRKLAQDDANTVKQTQQELLNRGMMTRSLYDRMQESVEAKEGGKTLDLAAEMLREGNLPQASQAERRARAGIDELRRGVERAAESVLGDDAEALRLAQSELDELTDQLQREAAQAQTPSSSGESAKGGASGREGEPQPGQGAGKEGERLAEAEAGGRGAGKEGSGKESEARGAGSGTGETAEDPASSKDGPRRLADAGKEGAQRGQPGENPGGAGERQAEGSATGGGESQANNGSDSQTPQDRAGGQRARGNRLADGRTAERGNNGGGGTGASFDLENMFDGQGEWAGNGPLTGDDFLPWTERLRDVEDLLEDPEMRNAVAEARERARALRREFRQDLKKPDWAVVRLEILKPLVEVRSRIREELARRESKNDLVPIDRDPVPNRYAEMVRKYYEELGKEE